MEASMPATGVASLLLVISIGLGVAALVSRSRRVAVLAAVAFIVFLAYVGVLLLVIERM